MEPPMAGVSDGMRQSQRECRPQQIQTLAWGRGEALRSLTLGIAWLDVFFSKVLFVFFVENRLKRVKIGRRQRDPLGDCAPILAGEDIGSGQGGARSWRNTEDLSCIFRQNGHDLPMVWLWEEGVGGRRNKQGWLLSRISYCSSIIPFIRFVLSIKSRPIKSPLRPKTYQPCWQWGHPLYFQIQSLHCFIYF